MKQFEIKVTNLLNVHNSAPGFRDNELDGGKQCLSPSEASLEANEHSMAAGFADHCW